jgi:hypothetical protein
MNRSNTTNSIGGAGGTFDDHDSMEDFDALPPAIREWMRYAIMQWSARYVRTTILPYAAHHASGRATEAVLNYLDFDNRKTHDEASRAGIVPMQNTLRVERIKGR